jgi:hypothetical protein
MSPTKSSTSDDPLDLPLLRELELDRELDELLLDREPLLNDSPPPGRTNKNVSLGRRADVPCAARRGVVDIGFLPISDAGAARAMIEEANTTKVSKSAHADRIGWRCRPWRLGIRWGDGRQILMRAARRGAR